MVELELPDSTAAIRTAITDFLFIRDEAQPVDICLVLGAPSPSSVDPAIELFRRGLTPIILISGRGPDELPEAEYQLLHRRALEAGIPAECMLLEKEARNTRDNFINSARLIEKQIGWAGIRSAAIVGKPFHMRRALMTARRWWPEHLRLLMLPTTDPGDLQPESWWLSARGRQRIFAEIERIGRYALTDDIRAC